MLGAALISVLGSSGPLRGAQRW